MKMLLLFSILFFSSIAVNATEPVNDPYIADVSAQWDTPTTYEDGTPLLESEIMGYRLYYNRTGETEQVVNLPPGTNSHTFIDLGAGDWEFKIATVAESEGRPSEVVSVPVKAGVSQTTITRVIIERCNDAGRCTQETIQ